MEDKDKLDDDQENSIFGSSTGNKSRSYTDGGDVSTLITSMSGVTEAGRGGAPAGKEQEEEEEEEVDMYAVDVPHESRAPDGGWGWMVALGTFIFNILIFSLSYCFGVFFSGFLLENGASSTTIAWIYNLHLVLFNLSMMLANPLCQEFGQRTIGFISVFIASLSIILSGFAPSVSFLYFSFSVLGGLSTGVSLGISLMVLPPYFHKKRGQANTFLTAGSPVSQIVLPPLILYLMEVYSLKGAALIHGVIILNGLIPVSFFHPVKWHLKPPSGEKPRPQQEMLQALMSRENTSTTTSTETRRRDLAPEISPSVPLNQFVQKLRRSFSGSASSVMSAESDVPGGLAFLSDEAKKSTERMKPGGAKALWRTLFRVAERIKSDLTVLRHFRCVIIALTHMLTLTTLYNFNMMLPFVTLAADHSLLDAARCIALLGVVNLVTLLVVSPLSDWKRFSVRFSIMLGYFLRASGIAVASLATERWQFLASGAVFGLGLGSSLNMFNPSIVHYMGMENLRPTIGITGMVNAVGFSTLGPLIGVIQDTTNSYSTSLSVLAALDLLSVALWFLMPAAQVRDTRMELRLKTSCDATSP